MRPDLSEVLQDHGITMQQFLVNAADLMHQMILTEAGMNIIEGKMK